MLLKEAAPAITHFTFARAGSVTPITIPPSTDLEPYGILQSYVLWSQLHKNDDSNLEQWIANNPLSVEGLKRNIEDLLKRARILDNDAESHQLQGLDAQPKRRPKPRGGCSLVGAFLSMFDKSTSSRTLANLIQNSIKRSSTEDRRKHLVDCKRSFPGTETTRLAVLNDNQFLDGLNDFQLHMLHHCIEDARRTRKKSCTKAVDDLLLFSEHDHPGIVLRLTVLMSQRFTHDNLTDGQVTLLGPMAIGWLRHARSFEDSTGREKAVVIVDPRDGGSSAEVIVRGPRSGAVRVVTSVFVENSITIIQARLKTPRVGLAIDRYRVAFMDGAYGAGDWWTLERRLMKGLRT